jgi:hypothetical protein
MRPQAAAFRLVVVTGYCPIRIIITSNAFFVFTAVASNNDGTIDIEIQHSDVPAWFFISLKVIIVP